MRLVLMGLLVCACSGGSGTTDGGGAGDSGTACTFQWTGSAIGMAACSESPKLRGAMTATNVGFLMNSSNDMYTTNFTFTLPKPPMAMMYAGTMNDQHCTASVSTKTGVLSSWVGSSKSQGSCSITFTSVEDKSSGSTSEFIVHGTANADLVKPEDMSVVTMTISF